MREAWSVVTKMVLIAGLAAPAAAQRQPHTRSQLQLARGGGEQTEQKQQNAQEIVVRARPDSLPKQGRWP